MPAIELMLPGFVYTSTVHCLHSCILVVVYLYYRYFMYYYNYAYTKALGTACRY